MKGVTDDKKLVLLDIDLTLIAVPKDRRYLSEKKFQPLSGGKQIVVINPKETGWLLKSLLADSSVELMFFTAGGWKQNLIKAIAETVGLGAGERERLSLCALHNCNTDADTLVNFYKERDISKNELTIFRTGLGVIGQHYRTFISGKKLFQRLGQCKDDNSLKREILSLSSEEMAVIMKVMPKFLRLKLLYPSYPVDKLLLVDDSEFHCRSFTVNGARAICANQPSGQKALVTSIFKNLAEMPRVRESQHAYTAVPNRLKSWKYNPYSLARRGKEPHFFQAIKERQAAEALLELAHSQGNHKDIDSDHTRLIDTRGLLMGS